MEMSAESNTCAHCQKQIGPGDRCMVYIDPKQDVPIKMLVHLQCWEEFIGKGVH